MSVSPHTSILVKPRMPTTSEDICEGEVKYPPRKPDGEQTKIKLTIGQDNCTATDQKSLVGVRFRKSDACLHY